MTKMRADLRVHQRAPRSYGTDGRGPVCLQRSDQTKEDRHPFVRTMGPSCAGPTLLAAVGDAHCGWKSSRRLNRHTVQLSVEHERAIVQPRVGRDCGAVKTCNREGAAMRRLNGVVRSGRAKSAMWCIADLLQTRRDFGAANAETWA